VIASVTLLKKD